MGLKHYAIQLANLANGINLTDSGGVCFVAQVGTAKKQALYNKDGTTMTNPSALTNGKIEFYVLDTVVSVDLYGQTGAGRGFVQKAVVPSGTNEIYIDGNAKDTTLVVPFDGGDYTATTETSTGFVLPTNAAVHLTGTGVDVLTAQAGKTLNVGILASEANGSATGFMNVVSLAAAGAVFPAPVVTAGVLASNTVGAFLADYTVGANSDDRGIFVAKPYRVDGVAHTVSLTTSATTTTAAGFIKLKMALSSV